MSLAPTARGLRLIRTTRGPAIEVPPTAGAAAILVNEAREPIVTESSIQLATGSMS